MDSKDKIKELKIDKKSALPIYYQIAKLFEECIFNGIYKPGDALPPELEIAEIFEVSRMTVRRAISELKDPTLADLAVIHGENFPTISKRILHVSIVRDDEAKVLNVKPNTPVFVVEQTIYDSSKKPVGWGRSIYRGDKYKITSITGWSKDNIK